MNMDGWIPISESFYETLFMEIAFRLFSNVNFSIKKSHVCSKIYEFQRFLSEMNIHVIERVKHDLKTFSFQFLQPFLGKYI